MAMRSVRQPMRVANVQGRTHIVVDGEGVDVAAASADRFPAVPLVAGDLGAPVPRPRQVFAIGMNYRDHADETGLGVPASPSTFTKFPTCITGPSAQGPLPPGDVDWEVELVVALG